MKLWGDKFRRVFSRIGDIHSLIPNKVKVLALTATATAETFHTVIQRLSMSEPILVAVLPNRINILYRIYPKVSIDQFSASLCTELAEK